jgi:predicted methyltransferase
MDTDFNSKTHAELKEICKQRKIKGISKKSKAELVKLLEPKETIDLSDMINKVSYGECVSMMKTIPSNSIDMVCTDPPTF